MSEKVSVLLVMHRSRRLGYMGKMEYDCRTNVTMLPHGNGIVQCTIVFDGMFTATTVINKCDNC